MSQSRAVAVAIVVAFLFDILTPDGGFDTIRKDCPSGAAAKVSHNRPVRMSESRVVASPIAVVTTSLTGGFIPDGGVNIIRKGYPSGATTKVSHNRPV